MCFRPTDVIGDSSTFSSIYCQPQRSASASPLGRRTSSSRYHLVDLLSPRQHFLRLVIADSTVPLASNRRYGLRADKSPSICTSTLHLPCKQETCQNRQKFRQLYHAAPRRSTECRISLVCAYHQVVISSPDFFKYLAPIRPSWLTKATDCINASQPNHSTPAASVTPESRQVSSKCKQDAFAFLSSFVFFPNFFYLVDFM